MAGDAAHPDIPQDRPQGDDSRYEGAGRDRGVSVGFKSGDEQEVIRLLRLVKKYQNLWALIKLNIYYYILIQ